MRRKAKVDDNQKRIVAAFRRMGVSVQHLHMIGQGCPDLLIGKNKVNLLVEIKDGDKVKSARKLTDDEIEWHEKWGGDVKIVNSVDEAVELVNNYFG